MRNAYKMLVRKPEGRRPVRRPRHRWEDNIKMVLREIRLGGMNWIHLIRWQACEHSNEPLSSIKGWEFRD
jgi:hypothetical protein